MSNRKFKNYKKFDVVCADFGDNLPGVQGGVRVGVVVSCDASNHTGSATSISCAAYEQVERHSGACATYTR